MTEKYEDHYLDVDEFNKIYWSKDINYWYLNKLSKDILLKQYEYWYKELEKYEGSADSEKEYEAQVMIWKIAEILKENFWLDPSWKILNKVKAGVNIIINNEIEWNIKNILDRYWYSWNYTINDILNIYEKLSDLIDKWNEQWISTWHKTQDFIKLWEYLKEIKKNNIIPIR